MAINWDFSAGTIVPIIVGFATMIWRIHRSTVSTELRTELRHAENSAKLESLEKSHENIERQIIVLGETQKECQKRITETREMVVRLDAVRESNQRRS